MRKEPYHCPRCNQTCSRNWNMKVHIQRKHRCIRQQPIGSVSHSTRAEFIPGMNSLGANGRYRHHEASPDYVHLPSELYPDKLGESSPLPTPPSKEKDASDKLLETIGEAVEIRKISKQLQSFSSPSSSFLGQLPDTVGLTMPLLGGIKTAPTPNVVNYNYALQLCNILINNKNVGFRGHVCYNCFECWVDLIYRDSEQIKSLINSARFIMLIWEHVGSIREGNPDRRWWRNIIPCCLRRVHEGGTEVKELSPFSRILCTGHHAGILVNYCVCAHVHTRLHDS